MTTLSERASAQSRGKMMAAAASASRIKALENEGLRFVWIDDITVFVENEYRFNVAGSSWVRIDDPDAHGYLVATLVTDFRKRSRETVVPEAVTGLLAETKMFVTDPLTSELLTTGQERTELEAADSHQHVESAPGHVGQITVQSTSVGPALKALMERPAWP